MSSIYKKNPMVFEDGAKVIMLANNRWILDSPVRNKWEKLEKVNIVIK